MSDIENQNDLEDLCNILGLEPHEVNSKLIKCAVDDPLFLHHLFVCKDDPEMRRIILNDLQLSDLSSYNTNSASNEITPALIKNAITAALRWAASGFKEVDEHEYNQRLKTCYSCEHSSNLPENNIFYNYLRNSINDKVCNLCGCVISKKAKLATEKCPDGKVGRWAIDQKHI